jgi:hypothetical protein
MSFEKFLQKYLFSLIKQNVNFIFCELHIISRSRGGGVPLARICNPCRLPPPGGGENGGSICTRAGGELTDDG